MKIVWDRETLVFLLQKNVDKANRLKRELEEAKKAVVKFEKLIDRTDNGEEIVSDFPDEVLFPPKTL